MPPTSTKRQSEIHAFRKEFQAGAARRDAVALRMFYTGDFAHTYTSGKVDGKDARIVRVLADEPTLELAATLEIKPSCFGKSACIAPALSPIKRMVDGKWLDQRWT